jgi:WD40 repeat protein
VYSPSGLQLASGSSDKMVRLWEAQSGVFMHTLEGHTDHVNSVVYSPSGLQLASGSSDKTVRLWEAHSGVLGHAIEGRTSTVNRLVSGSWNKTVRKNSIKPRLAA